jgi:hypothetical protein
LQALLSGKAIAALNLDKITIASGSVTDSNCTDFLPTAKIDGDCHGSSQDRLHYFQRISVGGAVFADTTVAGEVIRG